MNSESPSNYSNRSASSVLQGNLMQDITKFDPEVRPVMRIFTQILKGASVDTVTAALLTVAVVSGTARPGKQAGDG